MNIITGIKLKTTIKRRMTGFLLLLACHVVAGMLLCSCSMMHEDRADCPDCRNPLRIHLRYDYNTQRANMFSDHVEEATIYIVDDATGLVMERMTAANDHESQPLRNPSFTFNVEGLAPGRYRLYATGRSAADTSFVTTKPAIGQPIGQLQYALPADAAGRVPALRLDTVWTALQPTVIDIPENEPTDATIPLMRLTNDLSVTVFRRDKPADNSHERYDVIVTHTPVATGEVPSSVSEPTLRTFSPFAQWTTESIADGVTAERTAHYDFSLSRLVFHDDARLNDRLIIRRRDDGTEVVNIDLCHYLALARNAFETQHYSLQEYLDREYNYRLDFGLEGKRWKTVTISIDVLSWSIRIQNEEL